MKLFREAYVSPNPKPNHVSAVAGAEPKGTRPERLSDCGTRALVVSSSLLVAEFISPQQCTLLVL